MTDICEHKWVHIGSGYTLTCEHCPCMSNIHKVSEESSDEVFPSDDKSNTLKTPFVDNILNLTDEDLDRELETIRAMNDLVQAVDNGNIYKDEFAMSLMCEEFPHLKNRVNKMNKNIVQIQDNRFSFSIKCGDWLYPSKDSGLPYTSKYNIDYPLTLSLFDTAEITDAAKHNGHINTHLSSNRILNCEIILNNDKGILSLISLTNETEPLFNYKLDNYIYDFTLSTLDRIELMYLDVNKFIDNTNDKLSIIVTSILLQNHLLNENNKFNLYFRKATMKEIETIGRWY